MAVVRDLTGEAHTSAFSVETPLMEAGIDSLAATELSARLRALTGVPLSPTLVFEQPTPRAVAAHLLEQIAGVGCGSTAVFTMQSANSDSSVSLVGMVGRWPGGCNGGVARSTLQQACGDALGAVPSSRWTLELVVDVGVLSVVQAACVRHGGFVAGAQRFDAVAFGLSRAESSAIDPQHAWHYISPRRRCRKDRSSYGVDTSVNSSRLRRG